MNPPANVWLILTAGLCLSVGWGIRGNFGHEYGAMIPGALASMAAALVSRRSDWWRKVPYFGFLGALGWSLGGSMSYMQVIAYTHSGHSSSVLYGFACLFLIGFLWAALGGAGSALPACLSRSELRGMIAPFTAVFIAWCLQDVLTAYFEPHDSQFRQQSPLYWYDTDWLAATTALVSVGALALVRRRVDMGTSLVIHLAVGWWCGFLLLVIALGLRMTPPRGDNWAGCVGMVGGLWMYLYRRRLPDVTYASLIAGFVGGAGFATATLLKLVGVKSGLATNWHSVLEQTYGLINGVGLGLAFWHLSRVRPNLKDEEPRSTALDIYPIAFVLLAITCVNLSKNTAVWVQAKAVPALLYGWSAAAWFNLAYAIAALMVIVLLFRARQGKVALLPASPLGQGQLLCLLFLWWMVVGNFERALVGFAPQRLITEGVIHLNAALCTLLILLCPCATGTAADARASGGLSIRRVAVVGIVLATLSIAADWAIIRAMYGDQFAGYASLHIRFGPDATATKEKPKAGQPHP